jgi:hypothetical protein
MTHTNLASGFVPPAVKDPPPRRAKRAPNDGLSGTSHDGQGIHASDILLPAQFFAPFRQEAGIERERLLMLAVLADGVKCYRKYAFARDLRGRQIFAETLEWVLSREGGQLFSFESICNVLDINTECVRRALCRWYEQVRQARAGRPIQPTQASPTRSSNVPWPQRTSSGYQDLSVGFGRLLRCVHSRGFGP